MLELLERRFLMSVTQEGGAISVWGTDGADLITVSRNGDQLVIVDNGQQSVFDLSALEIPVQIVRIGLLGGNDRVAVDAAFDLRVFAYGHGGDDVLVGGAGDDVLHGGDGTDRLFGRDGNDDFDGGKGRDRLVGGAGDDSLYDPHGLNVLRGGAGFDEGIFERGKSLCAGFERRMFLRPVDAAGVNGAVTVSRGPDGRATAVVALTTSSGGDVLELGEVRREGSRFIVEVRLVRRGSTTDIGHHEETFDLGALPAGRYTFVLRDAVGVALIEEFTLSKTN